jgi:DNA-binding GntR family transcriptional regulator
MLTLSEATWEELFDFRELVEPKAAAGAAQHADAEQCQRLGQLAKLASARPQGGLSGAAPTDCSSP